MKCMTCDMEIDPKWKHAIDINVCPFCGENIMEDKLKNLFSTLRSTMEELREYQDQLNDWMLSNHNYIKTDSENLVSFVSKDVLTELRKTHDAESFLERKNAERKYTVKVKTEKGEEEVEVEKVQSEEKTQDFFKRAEVVKPRLDGFANPAEKTRHLKALAEQIKHEGAATVNASGVTGVITPEMLENADPEAVLEYQELLSGNGVASSIDADIDDDIPGENVVMALARAKGGTQASELSKLQSLQAKTAASRRNFASGAKGSFSRS